jgi:hypothetical protein
MGGLSEVVVELIANDFVAVKQQDQALKQWMIRSTRTEVEH